MKIRTNQIYSIIITLVLTIFTNFNTYILVNENSKWLYSFVIISMISCVINVIVLNKNGYRIISVAIIFIVLSYLFHMGQAITTIIAPDYVYISENFIIEGEYLTYNSLIFSYNIIQFVVIGLLMVTKKSYNKKDNYIAKTNLKYMAWIICLITVPMRVTYVFSAVEEVKENTYMDSIVDGYSGVYIQISMFCIIGFVLLYLAYQDNKKLSNIIFVSEIFILALMMLSGGRMFSIISIIILCICYYSNGNKIKISMVLKLVILVVLLLNTITTVTYLRTTTDISLFAVLQEIFRPNLDFVFKILDEFGSTIYTVKATLREVPTYLDYHYGKSYLKVWALAGVNIGNNLNDINSSIQYTTLFSRKYSFGGSYIGELYYNFSYYSIIVAPFIGMFVAKLSNKFECFLEEKKYYYLAYYVMPIYAVFNWVRGYVDGFSRAVVWGVIFIFAVKKFIDIFLKKKGG